MRPGMRKNGSDDYCDYSEFEDSWCGWGTYEEGWASCPRDEDSEDWEYDYEEKIWYLIEDGNVYFYDDEAKDVRSKTKGIGACV